MAIFHSVRIVLSLILYGFGLKLNTVHFFDILRCKRQE
jgi:hypothetical protein